MTKNELVNRYPLLYHMAESGSWPSILKYGLLSTSALLDLFEIEGIEREKIESELRLESISIEHSVYGKAVIRDQNALWDKPEKGIYLKDCLDGTTIREWCKFLNKKIFFWVDTKPLGWLINSPFYRNRVHCVISVDTRGLLDRHAEKVTLSGINSGSIWNGQKRGLHTFKPIKDYSDYFVTELAVEHSVPDIDQITVRVVERYRDKEQRVTWER